MESEVTDVTADQLNVSTSSEEYSRCEVCTHILLYTNITLFRIISHFSFKWLIITLFHKVMKYKVYARLFSWYLQANKNMI